MAAKSQIAREYRQKHGSEMPTKALARIMYKENKLVFADDEDARKVLRYIEGKTGAKNRVSVKATEFFKETDRSTNPYGLPESQMTSYEPYILKGHKRIAIVNDIHAPYQCNEALETAISFIKKEKVDGLVNNGDHFDFHGLSHYLKDPRKKNFPYEIETGCEIFRIFKKQLKCKIYYKLGNHDERYQHFLWQKALEIEGLDEFKLKSIVEKRVGEVEVIDDKRIIKAGGLNIVHGHEFGKSMLSPVNIARGFYMRAKASTIGGHHHRTSEHTEQDINSKIVTCWSVGCLSELHPSYLPINSWNHGFAIVDIDGRNFQVRNYRIYNGKVI